MSRKTQQYETTQYLMGDSYSEEAQTEDGSEFEDVSKVPVAPAQCHQRKAQNNIKQLYRQTASGMTRPETATQFLSDRRYLPQNATRVHPITTTQRMVQSSRPQVSTRHAQDYSFMPQPVNRSQPQRPQTANPDRFYTSNEPKIGAKFREPSFASQHMHQSPQCAGQTTRRPTQYTEPHSRMPIKQSTVTNTRPGSAQIRLPKTDSRFEESRTSTAAKAIALNFQSSLSSGLTMDHGDTYNTSSNPSSGQGCVEASKTERLAKSVSQTMNFEASSPVDQCGDGTKPSEPICGATIDQAVGLEKSKRMIVNLIDSAIEQLRTKESASKQSILRNLDGVSVSTSTEEDGKRNVASELKRECIRKLEEELSRLKVLENFIS